MKFWGWLALAATVGVVGVGVWSSSESSQVVSSSNLRRLPARRDYVFTSIDQLRLDLAASSIDIMKQDTVQAYERGDWLDISGFVRLVDVALDHVGVRGVVDGLFDAPVFSAAVNTMANQEGLPLRANAAGNHGRHQNLHEIVYHDTPSDRKYHYHESVICTGCVWWLRHYAGAAAADKFLRDGSLRLEAGSDTRLETAAEIMAEVRRIMHLGIPEPMSVDFNHGFVWQYMYQTMPELEEFPTQLAMDLCGDDFGKEGDIEPLGRRIGHECHHGFGHAVFMSVAKRELGVDFPVELQPLTKSDLNLSKESICEAQRICNTAPGSLRGGYTSGSVAFGCIDGFSHFLASLGTDNVDDVEVLQRVMGTSCEEANSRKE